ncbi:litaf-like zinc ribbon domain-containing [Purpureocillium lavendulum]|uniref:Litaf-like zinc ribbon domain-containing n=1 Tax=Purpureocillium lavendulum TaxID=1247861 RepID=A0AB34FIM7_9HYPO|nr:litaf-like zinc ribbon domain-containing [Purpureocillium lavendulum]
MELLPSTRSNEWGDILRDPLNDDWEHRIAEPTANHSQATNPEALDDQPLVNCTLSFRTLFAKGFFEERVAYNEWQGDQASMLPSLCNCAIILRLSDWTANICCTAIRYMTLSPGPHDDGAERLRLHALRIHGQANSQGQPQQGVQHSDQCNNAGTKLKNLGLAIAEIVCRTPFRRSDAGGAMHQKWNALRQTWEQIHEPDLLNLVHGSSKAEAIRRAVDFCLTARDPSPKAGGIGSFYLAFLEQVFAPYVAPFMLPAHVSRPDKVNALLIRVKAWAKIQQENHMRHGLRLRSWLLREEPMWPDQAFETPCPELNPVQRNPSECCVALRCLFPGT